MNQKAQDIMMQAPSAVDPERLKELHLKVVMPPQKVEANVEKVKEA